MDLTNFIGFLPPSTHLSLFRFLSSYLFVFSFSLTLCSPTRSPTTPEPRCVDGLIGAFSKTFLLSPLSRGFHIVSLSCHFYYLELYFFDGLLHFYPLVMLNDLLGS